MARHKWCPLRSSPGRAALPTTFGTFRNLAELSEFFRQRGQRHLGRFGHARLSECAEGPRNPQTAGLPLPPLGAASQQTPQLPFHTCSFPAALLTKPLFCISVHFHIFHSAVNHHLAGNECRAANKKLTAAGVGSCWRAGLHPAGPPSVCTSRLAPHIITRGWQ